MFPFNMPFHYRHLNAEIPQSVQHCSSYKLSESGCHLRIPRLVPDLVGAGSIQRKGGGGGWIVKVWGESHLCGRIKLALSVVVFIVVLSSWSACVSFKPALLQDMVTESPLPSSNVSFWGGNCGRTTAHGGHSTELAAGNQKMPDK